MTAPFGLSGAADVTGPSSTPAAGPPRGASRAPVGPRGSCSSRGPIGAGLVLGGALLRRLASALPGDDRDAGLEALAGEIRDHRFSLTHAFADLGPLPVLEPDLHVAGDRL